MAAGANGARTVNVPPSRPAIPNFATIKNTSQWKTTFRPIWGSYSFVMVKEPTNSDLVRLKQFLRTLESDDAEIAVEEVGEVEILRREIAYLEGVLYPSKAYLFRMAIDYGASPRA